MSAQWCDFPSGDVGLYGLGALAGIRDGTPYGQISNGVYPDQDPEIPSGRCLKLAGGADNYYATSSDRVNLPNPYHIMGASGRFWFPNYGTGAVPLYTFMRVDFQKGYYLALEPNGALSIYRIFDPVTVSRLATTSGPVTTTNAWLHLSFKVDCTTGEYSVEREGVAIGALTGTDGAPLGFLPSFLIMSDRGSLGVYMKDFFLWDGSGTVNNTHPGPATVYRKLVDSDVSSGWTKSTGTSDFALLDNPQIDDTKYISAPATLPAPSIMGMQNLPPDVVTVKAVMSVVRMAKSDGGSCQVQVSLSPDGAAWANGANRPITTSNTFWPDISELSPVTGDPWTPIEFNAAKIKINRTV